MKSMISMTPRPRLFAFALLAFSVAASVPAATWYVPDDFATVQDANDNATVASGDSIVLRNGNHAGALVSKSLAISGQGGATINSGPAHGSGHIMGFRLLADSGGAAISHLRFTVDLAIMNGGAVNDVTVSHCVFDDTVQGISNWRGSGWEIDHNTFNDLRTSDGGGIAILIGDYTGGVVEDNVVEHNQIHGTVHVSPDDGGGYNGTGIVLYADFRWGALGAQDLQDNRVTHNDVALVSDRPAVVDVAAIELTDTRDDDATGCDVIHNNAIGFNDLRGTTLQIALTPENLGMCNTISRNLGNNRGHGAHPAAFHD